MSVFHVQLAGTDYRVQALTVGQVEELHVTLCEPPSADVVQATRQLYSSYRRAIHIALSKDHPELTAEAIGALRVGSLDELAAAADKIYRAAGLVKDRKTLAVLLAERDALNIVIAQREQEASDGLGESRPPALDPSPGTSAG